MLNSVLFNQYKILKIIGKGGMGTVYLAQDIKNKTFVAIKKIEIKDKPRDLILREPRLLSNLEHKNIIKVYAVYETDDFVYMIMDYINGKSLKEILLKYQIIPEKQVLKWAIDLCDILIYLHNIRPYSIIYRDMKPSNILIDQNNNLTLIDFGIAYKYTDEFFIDVHNALTRGYCAPEQYTQKNCDHRCDIYSLGVTLYHLLTGKMPPQTPYGIDSVRKINKNVSIEMEFIILRATKIDPDLRYQTAEDLAYDFENIYKLNKTLKFFLFKQISSYALFISLYLVFLYIIFLGYKEIQLETLKISDSYTQKGFDNISDVEYVDAYDNFISALEFDKYSKNAYLGLFMYYDNTAKFKEGAHLIKSSTNKLSKIFEKNNEHMYYLGLFNYKLKNYRESFEIFDKLSQNDQNINYLFYRMLALIHVDAISMNSTEIYKLIDLKIDQDKLNFIYAEIYKSNKEFDSAVAFYDKVISDYTSDLVDDAYLNKALIYLDNPNFYQNPKDIFVLVLEHSGLQTIEILLHKANVYKSLAFSSQDDLRDKYTKLAVEDYVKVINAGRNELEIYITASYLYKDLKNYDLAIEILTQATLIYNKNFLPYYHLAYIQHEAELLKDIHIRDFFESTKNLEKAKELAIKQNMKNSFNTLVNNSKFFNN